MPTLALPAVPPRPLAASFAGWRSLHLEPGQRVRVVDGPGTLLRVTAGEAWLTEEGSRADVVLREGDAHRVRREGTTILEAQRASRVVIEVASDAPAPVAVALLPAPGEDGPPMSVPVAHPRRAPRRAWLAGTWRPPARAA